MSAEIKSLINTKGFSPSIGIKNLAFKALKKILSESELSVLWKESDGLSGWQKQLEKLQNNLIPVLEIDSHKRQPKKQRMPRSLGKLVDFYLKTFDPKAKAKIFNILTEVKNPNSQEKETDYDLPLNIAAKIGLIEAVSLLINKGADPNLISRLGRSSLILATVNNHVEIVEYLLNNGAELYSSHESYDENGNISKSIEVCPAILSVQNGNAQLVEVLEKHGANINETDLNGETLIFKAAEAGNTDLLSYLISRGLDVNKNKSETASCRGETALHYAVRANKLSSVKILIDAGADINAIEFNLHKDNPWCNTALDLCDKESSPELYEYLVLKGAKHAAVLPHPNKHEKETSHSDNI